MNGYFTIGLVQGNGPRNVKMTLKSYDDFKGTVTLTYTYSGGASLNDPPASEYLDEDETVVVDMVAAGPAGGTIDVEGVSGSITATADYTLP